MVAGIVQHEGEPVELLDPYWLFQHHSHGRHETGGQPICLLTGPECGWMDIFLRPLLERAGYAVVQELPPGQHAALVLAMDDDPATDAQHAPVLRLTRERAVGSQSGEAIFRYDGAVLAERVKSLRAGVV